MYKNNKIFEILFRQKQTWFRTDSIVWIVQQAVNSDSKFIDLINVMSEGFAQSMHTWVMC